MRMGSPNSFALTVEIGVPAPISLFNCLLPSDHLPRDYCPYQDPFCDRMFFWYFFPQSSGAAH